MGKVDFRVVKDLKELEVLNNLLSFNYSYDDKLIEELKKLFVLDNSLYIVAESDGKFAGFCSVDRDWWEEDYFFTREIIVDENFRKQGIGFAMMTQCINHAENNGAVGVVTETAFDNDPMHGLCAKLGFKKWNNQYWKEGVTYKINF